MFNKQNLRIRINMKCIIKILILLLSPLFLFAETKNVMQDLSQMSMLELMNVKITTAGKTAEKIRDIPASVVIITRKEIAQYGYQSLQEILENTLGMYPINDYNVLGTDMGVRGHKSSRANENIIFLVNGVNQTNDMYRNNPLNQILVPVEAIDKIEIVRGPMSVIYGSGAFYGAINIITNDYEKRIPKQIASFSYGTHNSRKAMLRLENNIANLDISINGSIYKDDGINLRYDELSETPPKLQDGSVDNNMKKYEKYFNATGKLNNFYFDMSLNQSQNNPFANYPLSKNFPTKIMASYSTIGYKKELTHTFTVDGKLTYSTYKEEIIEDYYNETYFPHYEIFKVNTYETDFTFFWSPHNNIDLTTGIYYRHSPDVSIRINAPSEGLPNTWAKVTDEIVHQAGFSQISFTPSEKLQFVGGLRIEDKKDYHTDLVFNAGPDPWLEADKTINNNKIHLIPRLAAIYQFHPNHHLKLLYGEAIKYSSFQLSITSLYMPNQPLLNPEDIQTWELNYIGKISSKLSTNISIFHNKLNNLISRIWGVDDSGNYYQYDSNKGELVTNGLEASFNIKLTNQLALKLAGQYQQSKDNNYTDLTPSFSPTFLGYFQTLYSVTNSTTLAFTGRYVGQMKSYWDAAAMANDSDNISDGYIGDEIDGYLLFNSNLRIKNIFGYGLFLNLKISNLLDTQYRYPTTSEVNWADKGYPAPGRRINLSLGKEF